MHIMWKNAKSSNKEIRFVLIWMAELKKHFTMVRFSESDIYLCII